MLKTIDILLGVAVVMLIVSMCVTMLTQAVNHLRETAGKNLLQGLGDLLLQIDPGMSRTVASSIATALLRHPLVNEGAKRLGTTIHREELTTLLLNIGAGNVPEELKAHLTDDARRAIEKILTEHGITDAKQTLSNVRAVALHLERASPELASNVRHSMALMQEVGGDLIGKVNAWFDQTMDRVSSRFTISTRQATVICSIAVAFALQLDVVGLVNRLSVDPELRRALVEQATEIANRPANATPTQPAGADANQANAAQTQTNAGQGQATGTGQSEATPTARADEQMQALAAMTGQNKQDLQDLVQIGVVTLPGRTWVANWGLPQPIPGGCVAAAPCPPKVNLLGVILSALMLSLGAPFWYSVMKNLVGLRSAIAGKDDTQRRTRQESQVETTTVAVSTSTGASAAATAHAARSLVGERGILG